MASTLERLLGVTDGNNDRIRLLLSHLTSLGLDPARFVPFLGSLIGARDIPEYPAPELDPSAFLDETLSRIVDWLCALADRTPHLLVVEDIHWADPSTLRLLGRLVERRPPGILTIATTRDDSVVPWRDAVEVLQLGRLDQQAAARLVDNIAAGDGITDHQRASIVGIAEGIPLVIEELTHFNLDEKHTEAMPLRLQELFTWRLKAPGVDPRVVQVAAAVGPTFDADIVSAVLGGEATMAEQLRILTDKGVIEPGDQVANTYRFRHALMRDAAYETQVLDVRKQTHAQVAETLIARGAEPAIIAEHLDLSGQAQRAVGLYLAAAQAEQGRGAHTEATELLSRALELLETLPESDERDLNELTTRMLRALSVSSMQGYAAHDVQVDHRWAEELAKRLGTRPEVAPSLIAIWAYWLTSGDLSTGRGLIDRLTDMVGQETFSWFQPEVEACAGWQDFYEGHLPLAQEHLERSVAGHLARPADQAVSPFWPLPNDPIAVAQIALASVSTVRGETDSATYWEREALQRAEEIGFPRGPFSRAFVRVYAAWNRRFNNDHDASRQLGAEVVAIGQEYGYVFWTTLGSAYIAKDPPGGEAHREFLQQTVATLRMMGQEAFVASNLGYLAQLHAAAGEIERALDTVAEALDVVRKSGEYLHLPELLRQRALYTIAGGGDSEEAVADLSEAERIATEQGARIARLRASLELARLPESIRPKNWRIRLEEARSDLPAAFTSDETAVADDLLPG
jgi:tetratricopeptide (TPR) repeat protein